MLAFIILFGVACLPICIFIHYAHVERLCICPVSVLLAFVVLMVVTSCFCGNIYMYIITESRQGDVFIINFY